MMYSQTFILIDKYIPGVNKPIIEAIKYPRNPNLITSNNKILSVKVTIDDKIPATAKEAISSRPRA